MQCRRQRVVLKVRAGGSELFGRSEALILMTDRKACLCRIVCPRIYCMPDCSFICYLTFFHFSSEARTSLLPCRREMTCMLLAVFTLDK